MYSTSSLFFLSFLLFFFYCCFHVTALHILRGMVEKRHSETHTPTPALRSLRVRAPCALNSVICMFQHASVLALAAALVVRALSLPLSRFLTTTSAAARCVCVSCSMSIIHHPSPLSFSLDTQPPRIPLSVSVGITLERWSARSALCNGSSLFIA